MSALTTTETSPITTMGAALACVSRAPSLPLAGKFPRTIFVTRLLAGSSDADKFLAHLLALPDGPTNAVAHCGGPVGPTFKSHNQALAIRLQTDDPDLTAEVVNFRLANPRNHMITLFDPECLHAALQLLDDLKFLQVPVDVIFITSRSEPTPKFLSQLEANGRRVVRAHKASLRNDVHDDIVIYPEISPQLEMEYARGALTLRQIVDGSSTGIQLAFERGLYNFATAMWKQLRG